MTTSGTFTFSPPLSRLTISALGRIGIKRTEIVAQHMSDAEFEANLLLCEWANRQPNLWLSELVQVSLSSGVATYTLDAEIVAIQLAYLTTTSGGSSTDRPLGPMSAVDYASQANKSMSGPPTAYWFNRQITPQITMWPVPDSSATYTLKLRCVRQAEDATMPAGVGVEIPYRFTTAFVDGLAARLGGVYPESAIKALGPNALVMLEAKADKSWGIASTQDTEATPMFITPSMGSYYR